MANITNAKIRKTFQAKGINIEATQSQDRITITTADGTNLPDNAAEVAASIGLTNQRGEPGGQVRQVNEMICYQPGAVARKRGLDA